MGRAREIATVSELVGEQRVVTLTGPGGIGKTRLAIEVAGRVRDSFPDGIVWIDLSPVDDPAMVPAGGGPRPRRDVGPRGTSSSR